MNEVAHALLLEIPLTVQKLSLILNLYCITVIFHHSVATQDTESSSPYPHKMIASYASANASIA